MQKATTAQPAQTYNYAYDMSARLQDSDWLILQNAMASIEHHRSNTRNTEAIRKLLDTCHTSDGQILQYLIIHRIRGKRPMCVCVCRKISAFHRG